MDGIESYLSNMDASVSGKGKAVPRDDAKEKATDYVRSTLT